MQLANLTDRQQQLVDLLMEMKSSKQISKKMRIKKASITRLVRRVAERWQIDWRKYDYRRRIVYLEAVRLGLISEY